MTDAATQAWHDQEQRHCAETIRRHGYLIQYVLGCGTGVDGPPCFAYTVGLFGLGHPELLVFGVSQNVAAGVFRHIFGKVEAGTDLLPGELLTFKEWPQRVVVEEVPNPGEIVFAANRHYQRPAEFSVPALQLTWDCNEGHSPWNEGYSAPATAQPRPGTFCA